MKLKIAVASTLILAITTVLSILLANLYIQQTNQKDGNQEPLPFYTMEQVAEHNTPQDCWIIIQQNVYNVSNFLGSHPGGADRIIKFCGEDATQGFSAQDGEGQHSASAHSQLESLQIGQLQIEAAE